jgi:hypothetical protein
MRPEPFSLAILLIGLVLATACRSATVPEELPPGAMRVNGIVHHYTIEGGFWGVRGDDGVTYDPLNLPAEFQQENLGVSMVVKVRDDLFGIHMVGPIVEIIQIQKI